MRLNGRLTLENFVFAEANRPLESALKRLADLPEPGALLLLGDEGMGKTHLLHAVGNRAQELDSRCRVCLLSPSSALRDGKWKVASRDAFREKNLFLIDNLDQLTEIEQRKCCEQLFQSLEPGCRYILTARKGRYLERLKDSIPGLIPWIRLEIAPLDLPARLTALRHLNDLYGNKFPEEALHSLATHGRASRHSTLESHVARIGAFQVLSGRPVDSEMVAEFLVKQLG
jgi:chromosomal replication initiator protein